MKKPIGSFFLLMLMGFSFFGKASTTSLSTVPNDTVWIQLNTTDVHNPAFSEQILITKDTLKQKKWVSALFAFPFPFGFMGAHRVMLGTKPWVPVVYVATFGGCFGLLPLIDFFVITFSKDITQYENNPNIFMWVKEKKEQEDQE
jgi:TM2 domain-containing membrane protein YozV